ncbi:MAG: PC4/YdbC family ssDNA-binding protein [Atopostipes suicloacalis]|nr:PC4/YdbC family ssDNA-binding protein [Atopostipes suicloacalis]
MADFSYEIIESFGVLSQSPSGWTRELNLVSWNDRPAKYDIRDWSPDHEKMGKGLTYTKEELLLLKEFIEEIED